MKPMSKASKKGQTDVLIDFNGKKHYLVLPGKTIMLDLLTAAGQAGSGDRIRNTPMLYRIYAAAIGLFLSPITLPKLSVGIDDYEYDIIKFGSIVLDDLLDNDVDIGDILDAGASILGQVGTKFKNEVDEKKNFTEAPAKEA